MKRLMKETMKLGAAALLGTFLAGSPALAGGDQAGKSAWGPKDEIGTLNMMTEASRQEILERIGAGKVYDLGVDLFVGMPD